MPIREMLEIKSQKQDARHPVDLDAFVEVERW